MTPSVPSGGDTEARQELRTIIERAIWDTAVVGWGLTSSGRDALVAKIADAVLDALGPPEGISRGEYAHEDFGGPYDPSPPPDGTSRRVIGDAS